MYISELVVEVFIQMRGNSSFDHMKDHSVRYEIKNRPLRGSVLFLL